MGIQVLITDAAIADLREIVDFVAQDDPVTAVRLGERLVEEALSLAKLPQRHAFHDRHRGIRKMPIPPFLVFYTFRTEEEIIHILHFWHGARLHPRFD